MQSTTMTPADQRGREEAARRLASDVLRLRLRLDELAESRAVTAGGRLAAEMAPVLEPVWGLLAAQNLGVGFLAQYGAAAPSRHCVRANAEIAEAAASAYNHAELLGPQGRQVWSALSRPAETLLDRVRNPLALGGSDGDEGEVPKLTLEVDVRPVLPGVLHGDWEDEVSVMLALRAVLRRWCDLARHACPGSTPGETARLTLAAALLARGAALDGDTATVRWFVTRWLGLRSTDTRVDGTTAALLEDGWTRRTIDAEFSAVRDTVTQVRIDTLYQHRLHRPVWETELRGRTVALLSELSAGLDGQPFDLAVGDDSAALVDIVSRQLLAEQMASVLDTISEREAQLITLLYQQEMTNLQVQTEMGISRYAFEKIRRLAMKKLRHPVRSAVLRDYLD